MKETLKKPADGSKSISEEKPSSSRWSSRIADLFADPNFELEWDNDFAYHIARHLQELRRYRGLTQAEVADKAGTTQPKVALAESGDANLTTETVCRFVEALDGRIKLSIEPSELKIPRLPAWWDYAHLLPDIRNTVWSGCVMQVNSLTSGGETFLAGWKNHPSKETLSIEASTDAMMMFTGSYQIPEMIAGLLSGASAKGKDK